MIRFMTPALLVLWTAGCAVTAPSVSNGGSRSPNMISADDSDAKEERRRRRRGDDEDDEELLPGDVPSAPAHQSTEVYHQRVRQNMKGINTCFAKALMRTPGMSGEIDIQFKVAPSGAVSATRVARTTLGDSQVGKCISAAIRELTFPAPSGGREIMVTHNFRYSSPLADQPSKGVTPTPPANPPAEAPPANDGGESQPGEGSPEGELGTAAEYRQYLVGHTGGIRDCYVAALRRNPELSGQIELRFAVSPNGAVALVEVTSSSLGDAQADSCVADAVRAVRFPRNAQGDSTIVTHSFAFSR